MRTGCVYTVNKIESVCDVLFAVCALFMHILRALIPLSLFSKIQGCGSGSAFIFPSGAGSGGKILK